MAKVKTIRVVVEIEYSKEIVRGGTISVQAVEGTDQIEIRNSDNDGLVNVTYPHSWHGESKLIVAGSRGGEDPVTVTL